jgi:hypothetical protein
MNGSNSGLLPFSIVPFLEIGRACCYASKLVKLGEAMSKLRDFADNRPLHFVIALAVLQPITAFPFVAAFRLGGQDIVTLRLVIPVVHSLLVLWVIWHLGWRSRAGLTGTVRNILV